MPFARLWFSRPIPLFVRLTVLVAAALLALVVAAFVLKLVIIAAILAALVLGGLFLFNFITAFLRIKERRLAAVRTDELDAR